MVPSGLLPNVAAGVTRRLDAERRAVAEERTAELIARIQPNPGSEARRRAVADYVKRLIMGCLSCQVFTFGSVPLKTYLPDGDIDVTAISNSEELKGTWAITVRNALEHEEKSENAEFRVREVQYIQAELLLLLEKHSKAEELTEQSTKQRRRSEAPSSWYGRPTAGMGPRAVEEDEDLSVGDWRLEWGGGGGPEEEDLAVGDRWLEWGNGGGPEEEDRRKRTWPWATGGWNGEAEEDQRRRIGPAATAAVPLG